MYCRKITGIQSSLGLVLFFCVVLNIMLIIKITRIRPEQQLMASNSLEYTCEKLLSERYLSAETEGISIQNVKGVESMSGKTNSLSDLFAERPLLVLRYSELHCSICIDYCVEYLKTVAKEVGDTNVIILVSYTGVRDLVVFLRINDIRFPVYKIPENSLGLPAEESGLPYFFITDESLIARHVHFPDENNPRLTRLFLKLTPEQYKRMSSLFVRRNLL